MTENTKVIEAQEKLCSYLKKSVVEFIDFDPNRDCK